MKNKLQYAYSITVFLGVLITAYMMMNKENTRVPLRAVQTPSSMRSEASVDSGVGQLFQMEDELSKLPPDKRRQPSDFSISQ